MSEIDVESSVKVEVQEAVIVASKVGPVGLVLLKTEEKILPLYIDAYMAASIELARTKKTKERPFTHDLFVDVLEQNDLRVMGMVIDDCQEHEERGLVFYSRLYVGNSNGGTTVTDSRPSDAMALCVRADAPIYVRREIIEELAVRKEDVEIQVLEEKHE